MELLLLLARGSWRTLALAILTGLICGLAAAALIATINDAITHFTKIDPQHALIFAGLALLTVVSRTVADISLLSLGQTTVYKLRLYLSNKLVDTPYSRLQTLGKHRLLAMLTDDTQTISRAVENIPIILVNTGIVVACLGYLGWLSLSLLCFTVVLIILGAISFQWPQTLALRSISKARERKDHLFDHYRSLSNGTKELQLNQSRRQQFFHDVLQPTSDKYKKDFVKGMSIYAVVLNWGNGIFYLLIGAVLYIAPKLIELEATLIIGYILTILYLITPLSELMNALPTFGQASVALKKIRTLEGQLAKSSTHQNMPSLSPVTQLDCKAVSHTYYREQEDGRFTLGPFDIHLTSGELVFITGGNGSGKTTLALLLTGLYQPESGDININQSISSSQQGHYYRQHFSAIFTDFCLFENLLNSADTALIEKAQKYLKLLQLDNKVSIENGKLSTLDLSTGQRKRLALLGAYLDDRPCYLFDEWAADQDPVFKQFFYTQILADLKQRNKFVIVISHDDAYFHLADQLIKVEQGNVYQQKIVRETKEDAVEYS